AVEVTLEPVRHLLPAVVAAAVAGEPGVVLLLQESGQFLEVAVEPVRLEPEHGMQPPGGPDRPWRQAAEAAGLERRAVRDVIGVGRLDRWAIDDGHVGGRGERRA